MTNRLNLFEGLFISAVTTEGSVDLDKITKTRASSARKHFQNEKALFPLQHSVQLNAKQISCLFFYP